jgi:hypothetical protein
MFTFLKPRFRDEQQSRLFGMLVLASLVTRPEALLRDIAETVTTRHELLHAAGDSALLSGILLIGYGLLWVMMGGRRV